MICKILQISKIFLSRKTQLGNLHAKVPRLRVLSPAESDRNRATLEPVHTKILRMRKMKWCIAEFLPIKLWLTLVRCETFINFEMVEPVSKWYHIGCPRNSVGVNGLRALGAVHIWDFLDTLCSYEFLATNFPIGCYTHFLVAGASHQIFFHPLDPIEFYW